MRLIGHRDLVRAMERLFRRAELPLGMSQGFHPKPRMSFPAALAVGIEGLDEILEIELAAEVSAEQLLGRLTDHAVPGLAFHHVEILPPGIKGNKARVARATCQIVVPTERQPETARRVAAILAADSCPIQRSGRSEPIDLHEFLEELTLTEGILSMTLRVTQQGAAPGPRDVLEVLGLNDLEAGGSRLRRTRVEIAS